MHYLCNCVRHAPTAMSSMNENDCGILFILEVNFNKEIDFISVLFLSINNNSISVVKNK